MFSRAGFCWATRIDKPGAIIAGNVRERKSGGGVLRVLFPCIV